MKNETEIRIMMNHMRFVERSIHIEMERVIIVEAEIEVISELLV